MVIQYGGAYWDFDFGIRFRFSNFHLAPHHPMLHWFIYYYVYDYVDMLYIMPYIIYMIHLFNIFHRIFCSYFTLFIANIVTLYTFFHRIYVVFTHFSIEFMQNDVQRYDMLSIFDALNYILFRQHLIPYHILLHLYFIHF